MISRIADTLRDIATDNQGTTAPLFAVMFMVLMFIVGMAVDFGRATYAERRIAAAADAAALAAGRAMLDGRLSDDDVRELGLKFFSENLKGSDLEGSVNSFDLVINRGTGTVKVDVDAGIETKITRVRGFDTVDVGVSAAVAADQQDLEVSLALDVTGSMRSRNKIQDLQAAAKDLVDILIPDSGSPNDVRIGLAPYAASVNAGRYADDATDGASNACVHERGGFEAFTDAAPGRGTWLGYSSGLRCPTAEIVPITDDKDSLKSAINRYRASGSTAGHIGTAWAWYLVSPEWASIWPSASRPVDYDDTETRKIVVLMTDGEFNTHYRGSNGDSSSQARSICSEMRDTNVIVYTIGFMSPPRAEALLQECASSADHYFNASNGSELRAAFVEIAQQLNNLRLTH